MPGKWVGLGWDEKAFVSPVCVRMGTDFPDRSGGCEEKSQVLLRPTPRHFPRPLHPGCPVHPSGPPVSAVTLHETCCC